jgi:hypothetical protein
MQARPKERDALPLLRWWAGSASSRQSDLTGDFDKLFNEARKNEQWADIDVG